MGTIKPWPTMFSNINTRNGHVDASVSLDYKNTMINRITMETVACLRSKCHLKRNLIPSWSWSFRHTSCISDFRCKTKYTNKKCCRTPSPAYFGSIAVLVIFCPLGPTNFKKLNKYIVKPAFAVTSIKQSSVLKGHFFLYCHRKFHMNWISFKRSSVL